MTSITRSHLAAPAGYSLVELIVSMGLLTVIMGVTMGGLASIMKGNEVVMTIATMNNSVRAGLDLMVRDLLQVGSGLPASHAVSIPNGDNSERVLIPGPPGTSFTTSDTDTTLPAVIPLAGVGPTINGVATDVLCVLMADNAFLNIALTSLTDTTVTVAAGPDLSSGPDRVTPGQLMSIAKGSVNTLVQVTEVDVPNRILTFGAGDSLNLNQTLAEAGTLTALNLEEPANATEPANAALATNISRIRMITYYIDATTIPDHPRLVRRINNGDAEEFDNAEEGTAVASDVVDLQFTFDISNGSGNPGAVAMTAADMTAGVGSRCNPDACGRTQIRKVNVALTSRAPDQIAARTHNISNTLESQVSLRAMAFVDRYR